MMEEVVKLADDDAHGPVWVHKSSEIRKWSIFVAAIIGAIALFATVNRYEGQRKAVDAVVAKRQSDNALRPNLLGAVALERSASVNSVQDLEVQLNLQNTGLIDAEIESVSIEVCEGIPTDEMALAMNAAQELAWPLGGYIEQSSQPSLGETVLALATQFVNSDQTRVDQLVATHPHGKLFSVAFPGKDLVWRQLEGKSATLKKDLVIGQGTQWSFNQNYVLTQYPDRLDRTWYNFSFIVRIEDDTAKDGYRVERYCRVVPAEPMPTTILTADGQAVSDTVYPWESGIGDDELRPTRQAKPLKSAKAKN